MGLIGGMTNKSNRTTTIVPTTGQSRSDVIGSGVGLSLTAQRNAKINASLDQRSYDLSRVYDIQKTFAPQITSQTDSPGAKLSATSELANMSWREWLIIGVAAICILWFGRHK